MELSIKELKALNKANKLMNNALALINEVNASNKDFKYNPMSYTTTARLTSAISQLEAVEGVLKMSDI